jgi:hypothetical protein
MLSVFFSTTRNPLSKVAVFPLIFFNVPEPLFSEKSTRLFSEKLSPLFSEKSTRINSSKSREKLPMTLELALCEMGKGAVEATGTILFIVCAPGREGRDIFVGLVSRLSDVILFLRR